MQTAQLLIVAAFLAASTCNPVKTVQDNYDAKTWWKTATFYQIYPRSLKDDNNDGIGDLKGIIGKLDHFVDAGVTGVWLSPIFSSPQVDQGYDISDYYSIDPSYGTIDDVKELVKEAHERGIKVILDFVPNHTSDKHEWFQKSVRGVSEYRDYYVWANANFDSKGNRLPPNNWISLFKNSAWTWNEERQQYYLHQFAYQQPDLNYNNPNVVEAMKQVLVFWMDQGIDGFRVDAVPFLIESSDLADEPKSNIPGYNSTDYEYLIHTKTKDLQGTFDVIYDWRKLVDDYSQANGGDQRVLMTEAYTDQDTTMLYFGTADGSRLGAHFTFNFNLITDLNIDSKAKDIVNAVNKWLDAIPKIYTSNWVIGNHDNHRAATRFGPGNVDGYNMLKSILPGIAVTYNGEEIGQENGEVKFEEGQDPSARDPAIFDQVSRDFERTPFQWDETVNAGFNTGAKPWLPVSKKYTETNLKKQKESQGQSHYKIYKALAEIRSLDVLKSGDVSIKAIDDDVVFVKRSNQDSVIALVFNVGEKQVSVNLAEEIKEDNKVEISSVDSTRQKGSAIDAKNLTLDPHEALIISA